MHYDVLLILILQQGTCKGGTAIPRLRQELTFCRVANTTGHVRENIELDLVNKHFHRDKKDKGCILTTTL